MTDNFQTKEEAIAFVRNIFQQMGGTVISPLELPPTRPGHCDITDAQRNSFMMDFENHCLEQYWEGPPPKGIKRYEDPKWAAMIQSEVYPNHSDIDWQEYVNWVSCGYGDEWFQEDDDETPPPPILQRQFHINGE